MIYLLISLLILNALLSIGAGLEKLFCREKEESPAAGRQAGDSTIELKNFPISSIPERGVLSSEK